MSDFLNQFFFVNSERQKLWDPDGKTTNLYRAVEHCGEAGELANVVKKLERERVGLVGSRSSREALLDELGDNFITLVLLCHGYGVTAEDFKNIIRNKFNKTSRERGLPEWK